jgi:peptidoglycan/LPS O-acetylase OafA/YrhL
MYSNQDTSYRRDIDGLRAVAVAAVIIHHFFLELLPSGFLGVDVFFVISGYVITQSLFRIKANSLTDFLATFYARRVRRLMPALLFCVMITATAFVIVAADPPAEVFRTGALALLGLSNLYLAKSANDYFSLASQLNPFTQTWSLSVEEQFYLIYPPLLIFIGLAYRIDMGAIARAKRYLLALSCASLLTYLYLQHYRPSLAFYMMPARFWELCAGGILYLSTLEGQKKGLFAAYEHQLAPTALIGLIALFFLPQDWQAIATVLAVACTAIIIRSAPSSALVIHVLCLRPVQFIGLTSYSLYLWHWSVLVIGKYSIGTSSLALSVLLALTLLLSSLSYYAVERPFRFSQRPATKFGVLTSASAVVVPCVLLMFLLFPQLKLDQHTNLAARFGIPPVAKWGEIDCHGAHQLPRFADPFANCLEPERTLTQPRALFLLGDSHAAQFTFMAHKALENSPYSLRFINTGQRDDFPRGFGASGGSWATFDKVLEYAEFGDVVVVAFHRGRLNPDRDAHLPLHQPVTLDRHSKRVAELLSLYIARFAERGVRVLLVRDTPLMAMIATSESCHFQRRLFGSSACEISLEQDLHTRTRQDLIIDQLVTSHHNAADWDPGLLMFAGRSHFEVVDDEGRYTMMDSHHITREQSERLAPAFIDRLEKFVVDGYPKIALR